MRDRERELIEWNKKIEKYEKEEGMVEWWKKSWAMFEGVFCVPILFLKVVHGGASDHEALFLFVMKFGCWMMAA